MADDFSDMLHLSKAHFVKKEDDGLNHDAELTLYWENIPNGLEESALEWESSNRRTLVIPEIEGEEFAGTWRTLSITTSKNRVTHVFALGLHTTLGSGANPDWSLARWVMEDGSEISLGNAGTQTDADSIADTTSDSPEHHILLKFPFVDPIYVNAACAALNESTYTSPTVNGSAALTGVWHNIIVRWKAEEDGSCTVYMHLARPQYTLEAYQNFDTAQGGVVFYLWNVPKDLAQTIISAWKSTGTPENDVGKTASASYTRDRNLVDIQLSRRELTPKNLTTDAIPVFCDTDAVYHFAWGYTEAQLEDFLANHASTLGTGQSREIRVSSRGDGMFDAVVEERTQNADNAGHFFYLSLVEGLSDTASLGRFIRTTEWGWHVSYARLEIMRATYDVAAVGVTTSFRVERHDNCTYDYTGVREVERARQVAATSDEGGEGILRTLRVATGIQSQTDLQAILDEAALRPGKRRTVDVDINLKGNSTLDAKVEVAEVQAVSKTATVGMLHASEEVTAAVNQDDLPTILAPGIGERVTILLEPSNTGAVSYRVTREARTEHKRTESVGSYGERVAVTEAINSSDGPTIPDPTVTGRLVTLQETLREDKLVEYVMGVQDRFLVSHTIAFQRFNRRWERASFDDTVVIFKNATAAEVTTLATAGDAADTYYFERLEIDDGFMFAGILHKLTVDPNAKNLVLPSGAINKWNFVHHTLNDGTVYRRKQVYNEQRNYNMNDGQLALINMRDGAMTGNDSFRMLELYGVTWFETVRMTLVEEGEWEKVVDPF